MFSLLFFFVQIQSKDSCNLEFERASDSMFNYEIDNQNNCKGLSRVMSGCTLYTQKHYSFYNKSIDFFTKNMTVDCKNKELPEILFDTCKIKITGNAHTKITVTDAYVNTEYKSFDLQDVNFTFSKVKKIIPEKNFLINGKKEDLAFECIESNGKIISNVSKVELQFYECKRPGFYPYGDFLCNENFFYSCMINCYQGASVLMYCNETRIPDFGFANCVRLTCEIESDDTDKITGDCVEEDSKIIDIKGSCEISAKKGWIFKGEHPKKIKIHCPDPKEFSLEETKCIATETKIKSDYPDLEILNSGRCKRDKNDFYYSEKCELTIPQNYALTVNNDEKILKTIELKCDKDEDGNIISPNPQNLRLHKNNCSLTFKGADKIRGECIERDSKSIKMNGSCEIAAKPGYILSLDGETIDKFQVNCEEIENNFELKMVMCITTATKMESDHPDLKILNSEGCKRYENYFYYSEKCEIIIPQNYTLRLDGYLRCKMATMDCQSPLAKEIQTVKLPAYFLDGISLYNHSFFIVFLIILTI